MNRGGIGSASIMLVFVVLCLVIFAIISLSPALTERTLANAEVQLIQEFYAADAIAEQILAEILAGAYLYSPIMGIDVITGWNMQFFVPMVYFTVPINDTMVLFVEIGLDAGYYHILAWQMVNLHEWVPDESINLFDPDTFFQGW